MKKYSLMLIVLVIMATTQQLCTAAKDNRRKKTDLKEDLQQIDAYNYLLTQLAIDILGMNSRIISYPENADNHRISARLEDFMWGRPYRFSERETLDPEIAQMIKQDLARLKDTAGQ